VATNTVGERATNRITEMGQTLKHLTFVVHPSSITLVGEFVMRSPTCKSLQFSFVLVSDRNQNVFQMGFI